MASLSSINPSTGKLEQKFEPLSVVEVDDRLNRSVRAFQSYRHMSFQDRAQLLMKIASMLEAQQAELGRLMTLEMGKPYRSSIDEVKKCAWNCRYFAENGPRFLSPEKVDVSSAKATVRFDPLGVLLAVMPWNFPFWQVFRFAAPALMAGNVIVLKHASNVPRCALKIEELFKKAGYGEEIFQTLLVGSDRVEQIIQDPRIAAISLTGSVEAGKSVAQAAGRAIKKTVLELGGSDPFIVMPSADIDQAVQVAVEARILNSGQSCIAAKRFIVSEKIAAEFENKFLERMESLHVGDPFNPKTQVGPLATEEVLKRLEEQVKKTVKMGAKILMGGKRIDRSGFFYAPTVLTEIPKASPAYSEELFGPVAPLFYVRDPHHAIALANDSQFGLGASVWTKNEKEQELFVQELQSGNVFIHHKVASDPRLPFGGVKSSGYGRELAIFGIREFVNIKTVSIFAEEKG